MPNIKSAKKRHEISQRRNLRNSAGKTVIKNTIKKFESVVATGNHEEAQAAYKNLVKTLDKAVSKGFLHKNTAARKKSRYSKSLKNIAS